MYLRLILRGEMVLSVPNMEVLLQPIHFFCCFWLYCLLSELCGRGKSHLDESNSDAMHEVDLISLMQAPPGGPTHIQLDGVY
jgi:hypothetical protein